MRIEAEDRIASLIASAYPHLKEASQQEIMKSYQRLVNPGKKLTIQEERQNARQVLNFKKK